MARKKVISTQQLGARAYRKLRLLLQGSTSAGRLAAALVSGKDGLEIGGPSNVFQSWPTWSRDYGWLSPAPIYSRVGSLDNCNFAGKTIWAEQKKRFNFHPGKRPGTIIIADGSAINPVPSATYDFVLSSHNLEHFANPIKALKEWQRVTRAGGALILVLPDFRYTFDHRRTPTPVEHMQSDYDQDVGEDDLTHLEEVLALHDCHMDGTLVSGTLGELRSRSERNFENRIMHHHVFDEHNSVTLLEQVGLQVLAVQKALPYHLVVVSRWKVEDRGFP